MKQFDTDQIQAINAHGGYYLVLAPPGCGKTDILAERIAKANEQGVPFEDMLCLTFTNRASRGMRNRIMERIGEDAKDVFVGNIHRYCSNFLFHNQLIAENSCVIDDDDQADILLSFDQDAFLNKRRQVNKNAVKAVTDLASYIRQSELGHPEKVKFAMLESPALYALAKQNQFNISSLPAEKETLIYALMYQEYKEKNNLIDFSDILIDAYDELSKNTGHKRYKWIQVDEVQDLNSLQTAIIDELTATDEDFTVMYLGDEQQAIFSFMGAKLDQLTALKRRCSGHILTLGLNYRAPEYLLNVCNTYAENELGVDPDILPKPVKHDPGSKWDLILCASTDYDTENERVYKMIDYYLKLADDERLAVLVPTNDAADRISSKLGENGITNFKISGRDMFRTKAYKTIAAFYAVLVNDFNAMAWARLLYGINAVQNMMQARALTSQLKGLMMTPTDLLADKTYLQKFIDTYQNREMVFFDTETTGLNVLEDDIVQIAAFKVRNGQKVDGSDFNILLETNREIPEKLGDIVNPLIAEYAERSHYSREEGLRMFLDYIGDDPILGHNVMYDYRILQKNTERTLDEAVNYEIYDSLHLIKCVEPRLRMYKLAFLLKELNLLGQNSHLANEDIEATKSLVDYCVNKAMSILPKQKSFMNDIKVQALKKRMQILQPMFEQIEEYVYFPVEVSGRTIADELHATYETLHGQGMIDDLGNKYDTFLRFAQSEWVDFEKSESLFDQIATHINDMTSSISEGDLVNSSELLQDRVFVMTVYKGKGLEFDNVIVLGAVDGTYPFFSINKVLGAPYRYTPKEVEEAKKLLMEDARKFYVAISRAKKRLCVSYARTNAYGYPTNVTPFMRSIRKYFLEGK